MLLPVLRMLGVALVLLFFISLASGWRITRPVQRFWSRHGSYVRWYVTSAPATFVYLAILFITTWVLLGMPDQLRTLFIEAQSTNLRHLTQNPIRALIRSAFFVTNRELLAWTVLFAMLLAPAERWLGTGRFIAVFAVGHITATAGAALDVWLHIQYLGADGRLWNVEDTGASYGFMALTALMFYRLAGRSRVLIGVVLGCVVFYALWEGAGFTARGHAIAVLLGLALYPMTRIDDVRERTGAGLHLKDLWKRSTADGPEELPAAA